MAPKTFSLTYFITHLPVINDSKEVAKLIATGLVATLSYRFGLVELLSFEMALLVFTIEYLLSLIDAIQKTHIGTMVE